MSVLPILLLVIAVLAVAAFVGLIVWFARTRDDGTETGPPSPGHLPDFHH